MIIKLTPEEQSDFIVFGETLDVIANLLATGDATPETLRMAAAAIRQSANALDVIAARNERKSR